MAYYIDEFPGRELVLNNKKHLYFGGTAYLGLQTDPKFTQHFIDNVKKYGTSYGASRKSNVRLSLYGEAETYLADLTGSEGCTTLSSGYLAGQLICHYFNSSNAHALFYAPNSHSALYQGNGEPYTTYKNLKVALEKHLESKKTIPVVFLDTIDFSGMGYPDFASLKTLPLDKIILIADDSHGIGIIGKNGNGCYAQLLSLNPKELVVCCSLGKGFGIQAGALFGTKERINDLKNTAFFGGASPATPASMATLVASGELYAEKRKVLFQNRNLFLDSVTSMTPFAFMKGHPTFSYSNSDLTQYLEAKHIIVTDFNYPSEAASLMSRIVLTASHLPQDIKRLSTCINTYFSK